MNRRDTEAQRNARYRVAPASEPWGKACLFAQFVRGDAVDGAMALDRNGLCVVGVNGVLLAFAEEVIAVLFEVPDDVAALDRHP